jgi:hypothetical protein
MSILIISLPRTGSTELGTKLSIDNKLKYEFEPFNPLNNIEQKDINFKKCVLKTIIFQIPPYVKEINRIEWLISLSKNFNEVILLSRKNLVSCAESWSFLNHKMKTTNFLSTSFYLWEKTPNYETALENIKKWNGELEYISERINTPITYYEDIYDLHSPNRLRRGNKDDFEKNII